MSFDRVKCRADTCIVRERVKDTSGSVAKDVWNTGNIYFDFSVCRSLGLFCIVYEANRCLQKCSDKSIMNHCLVLGKDEKWNLL